MGNELDWIAAAIAKAKQKVTTGPDTAWNQVEGFLRGSFSERPLTAMQLENFARRLMDVMVPAPAKLEEPR